MALALFLKRRFSLRSLRLLKIFFIGHLCPTIQNDDENYTFPVIKRRWATSVTIVVIYMFFS